MPFEGVGFNGRAETPPVPGRLAVPTTGGRAGRRAEPCRAPSDGTRFSSSGSRAFPRGKAMIEPEMVSYALRYDLQPFHIDTVAATGSGVGGSPGSR